MFPVWFLHGFGDHRCSFLAHEYTLRCRQPIRDTFAPHPYLLQHVFITLFPVCHESRGAVRVNNILAPDCAPGPPCEHLRWTPLVLVRGHGVLPRRVLRLRRRLLAVWRGCRWGAADRRVRHLGRRGGEASDPRVRWLLGEARLRCPSSCFPAWASPLPSWP